MSVDQFRHMGFIPLAVGYYRLAYCVRQESYRLILDIGKAFGSLIPVNRQRIGHVNPGSRRALLGVLYGDG